MHDDPRRMIGASYFCKFPIPVSRENSASSPTAVSFFRQEKYSGARDFRAFFSGVSAQDWLLFVEYFPRSRPCEQERRTTTFYVQRETFHNAQKLV